MSEARSALVARVEAGDRAALPLLMATYHDEMVEHANRRLPPHLREDVAADIVQHAFLSALKDPEALKWEGLKAFESWVRTVVNNHFASWCRYVNRQKRRFDRLVPNALDDSNAHPADSDTPPRRAIRAHRDQMLLRVMKAVLSPEQFRMVWLRYVEHVSVNDTAAVLDCTPAAVKMRCQRALARIREALGRTSAFFSSH